MATVFIGDQFDRLCAAMEVAFSTPQSLEEFVRRKLGLRLNRIVGLSHPMSYICTQFVDWIDTNDQRAAEVLDKLEAFYAHCTILVAICREIKGRPASVVVVQPVPANDVHDPADAQLILNSRVFCDREVVRDEVKKMVNGTDTRALITRVLIINGRSKVGKSECLSYLAHLEHAGWNTIRIVSIDLSVENDPAMRPDHLARRLALNLDIPDGPPSPRAEQSDPRWLGDLVTWLNNLLRKQDRPVWIVLDGFRHELVPQLTHDFIIQFAKRLCVAAPNVRMVLLDYEKLTEESNDIKLVNLDYIGAKDVALFRQWVVPHLLPVEPPIANSLYQEVINRMPEDERERMLFLGKTLPRLLKQLIEAK